MDNRYIGELILDEAAIAAGVERVAALLNERYQDAVMITVVPGGMLFTADLVRKLAFTVAMDTISCPHTPGDRSNQSAIVFHHNIDINGRDVIVVDDAIESGGTMKRLVAYLSTTFAPKSLAIATLFVKPGRIDIPFKQFYAYEMESDDLLIGYGLPWENRFRNIPFISKLKR